MCIQAINHIQENAQIICVVQTNRKVNLGREEDIVAGRQHSSIYIIGSTKLQHWPQS